MKKKLQKILTAVRSLEQEYRQLQNVGALHFKSIADEMQAVIDGKESQELGETVDLRYEREQLIKLCAQFGTTVMSFEIAFKEKITYSVTITTLFPVKPYAHATYTENQEILVDYTIPQLKERLEGFLKEHKADFEKIQPETIVV